MNNEGHVCVVVLLASLATFIANANAADVRDAARENLHHARRMLIMIGE